MAIVGDELNEYVIKQINQRQSAHGSGQNGDERTLEELTYLNSKTAWIKFASGVSVTEAKLEDLGFTPGSAEISELVGKGLAQKYVLYNGISTITDVNDTHYRLLPFSENGYEVSSDYGIIPTPGIIDLDVKALNRGSLKKATIKLKVQDRSQLSIIDTLYMRLGYTVLLEWGNSVFLDENGNLDTVKETIVERKDLFFSDNMSKGTSYTAILTQIEEYRKKYCGNYDGMLGKISNFSWTFNQDGSYDVDLTVISWGDVIESLKSNVTADKKTIDFVEDTPIPSQEGTIVNTKRKDNIIFSLLHAMKFVATDSTTGKGGNITIDGASQGNFITSGSAKIQVQEQKIQFTAKYTLMHWGGLKSSPVESTEFTWFKIGQKNYDVFKPALQQFPFYDIDSKITTSTKNWEKNPPTKYVVTPPGTKMDQSKGTYTYQEVVTRTTGDPNAPLADSTLTAAPGISNDMLYFRNFINDINLSPTKPSTATFTNQVTTWYQYVSQSNGNNIYNPPPREKPFPSQLGMLIDNSNFNRDPNNPYNVVKWRDVITHLAINWNHPGWVWGITIAGGIDCYAGLTTKWGIDGGTNFDLANPGLTTTFFPPNLQKITTINDSDVVRIRAEEFKKFTDANPTPTLLSQPPTYDSDGKPIGDNYEFFHRFVAKDEAEAAKANSNGKRFWWKVEFFDEAPLINQQQFDNPLIDLKFDTKGVFQLNTDPISYYLKFGFLLQILKDKVVFKIDESKDDHKDNTSIFQINDEPGSSEMLCIRSATIGQISYDFRTCIVRRDKFTKPWIDPNDPNQGTQKVFPELDVWANEDNIKITDENKKYTAADTMNVYLNFDFIGRCMESNTDEKGNTSMYGFINSICAGINKSLGGINNLEPIIDETTNTLNIVDTSPKYVSSDDSPTVNRTDPYQLQLYGYTPRLNLSADVEKYYPTQASHYESTFARKVNLKTAITPEYATMITVGAAAGGYVKGVEATSFAKWNNGIIDRFKQNLIPASLPPLVANATGSSISVLAQSSIEDTLVAYQQVMTKSPNCFGIVP
jgi:hypothetical protein